MRLHCLVQAAQFAESLQKLIPQLGYLAKILPPAVLQWKLELLKQGNQVVKPLLPKIQQRVFLLTADNDLLIPSKEEGPRLKNLLPRCRHKVCFPGCILHAWADSALGEAGPRYMLLITTPRNMEGKTTAVRCIIVHAGDMHA